MRLLSRQQARFIPSVPDFCRIAMTADLDELSLSSSSEKEPQRTDADFQARRRHIAIACLTPLILCLISAWYYIFVHTHTIRAHLRNLAILAAFNVILITAEFSYDYFCNLHRRRRNRVTELQTVSIQT